jgi:hypothetical protein
MKLGLPNSADFVLIVHNMFESHKTVSTAYLRALAPVGEITNGELFAEMSSEDLQSAARRQHYSISGNQNTGEKILQSMSAVTKGMAHSSGASGNARSEMFPMCTSYGLPALFFTITPEHQCNFRIHVMKYVESPTPPPSKLYGIKQNSFHI